LLKLTTLFAYVEWKPRTAIPIAACNSTNGYNFLYDGVVQHQQATNIWLNYTYVNTEACPHIMSLTLANADLLGNGGVPMTGSIYFSSILTEVENLHLLAPSHPDLVNKAQYNNFLFHYRSTSIYCTQDNKTIIWIRIKVDAGLNGRYDILAHTDKGMFPYFII
jgi:hypothetical protein